MINDSAKIVLFKEKEDSIVRYGFLYDNKIICACCGGIVDVAEAEVTKIFNRWCPIDEFLEEEF